MASLAVSLAGPALAGPPQPRHRLIDPTEVDDLATGYRTRASEAHGMNALNQVVGQVEIETSPGTVVTEAFLWLPEPAYGLAAGFHRLASLPGAPGGASVARDINDRGQIVGALGFEDPDDGPGVAHLWDLSVQPPAFHILPLGTVDRSRALAINNDIPNASIVGSRMFPAAPPLVPDPVGEAFLFTLGASGPSALVLGDGKTEAYDLTPTLGSTIFPVGDSDSGPISCQQFCAGSCPPGVIWENAGEGEVLLGRLISDENRGKTRGLGVNAQQDVVGWSGDDGDGAYLCGRRAAFWVDPWANPMVEPTILPFLNGIVPLTSTANAISPRFIFDDRLYVVGADDFQSAATLWIYEEGPTTDPTDPADWVVFDLDRPTFACLWGDWIELLEANDVSTDGWICGRGRQPFSGVPVGINRAFVLFPVSDCPSDLDGSGVVDTVDLLALLEAWGPCELGMLCPQDIVGAVPACATPGLNDRVVDTADLLRLLADCGPCGAGSGVIPADVIDCLNRFEPGSLELDKCLWAVLGGQ